MEYLVFWLVYLVFEMVYLVFGLVLWMQYLLFEISIVIITILQHHRDQVLLFYLQRALLLFQRLCRIEDDCCHPDDEEHVQEQIKDEDPPARRPLHEQDGFHHWILEQGFLSGEVSAQQ